jgi:hypothetical protein
MTRDPNLENPENAVDIEGPSPVGTRGRLANLEGDGQREPKLVPEYASRPPGSLPKSERPLCTR